MTTVNLAHGASGSAASMSPHVEGLRKRGLDARAIQLPVGKAEKAVEVYPLEDWRHELAVELMGTQEG